MQRTQEEKDQFYKQLGDVLDNARNDSVIVLGDLNTHVRKHSVGNMYSN